VRLACDEAERVRFWAGRKNAFPAVGRISPDYYCMDGTIPRRELPRVLKGISELSAQYGLRVANVFHAGDGNMHPLILFDANLPGELERAEAIGGRILELCVAVGGSITGEHGVGREKINQMCAVQQRRNHPVPRVKPPSTRRACSTPARTSPPCTAAPNSARCTCTTAAALPDLERF
jgi:FAD/FMN-containing dehydrogenase